MRWSEEEINYLIDNYNKQPTSITALKLNRSASSLRHKASKLGIKRYSNLSLKDLSDDVALETAKILDKIGGVVCMTPKDTNRLKKTIYFIKINAGKNMLDKLEWLVQNVGGRISETTHPRDGSIWYIWGIYKQDDVMSLINSIKPYSEKFYEKFSNKIRTH